MVAMLDGAARSGLSAVPCLGFFSNIQRQAGCQNKVLRMTQPQDHDPVENPGRAPEGQLA